MSDKDKKMNMPTVGFAAFDQEVNAFTVVLDTVICTIQRELETKNEIKEVCKHMDTLSSLSTILLTQLEESSATSDQVILFPVEFDVNISVIKGHLSENFTCV